MSDDDRLEAAAREYLNGAIRALDRGDAASASTEIVAALRYSFAVVRQRLDPSSSGYLRAWTRVANELSKLNPTLLHQAVRILGERPGPSTGGPEA